MPAVSAPPAIEPPKQAEKAPGSDVLRAKNKTRMSGGMDGGTNTTFLTGPTGVDPNALALGKTTLLGQ
jgi:hypothetical protein